MQAAVMWTPSFLSPCFSSFTFHVRTSAHLHSNLVLSHPFSLILSFLHEAANAPDTCEATPLPPPGIRTYVDLRGICPCRSVGHALILGYSAGVALNTHTDPSVAVVTRVWATHISVVGSSRLSHRDGSPRVLVVGPPIRFKTLPQKKKKTFQKRVWLPSASQSPTSCLW